MVREMSLIRGPGAPAKEMSFPHHLALFKDHPCLLLPTISWHFPLFPAKKMSQSLVALQYGRRSRAPDVSGAPLSDSPAARLSKRIMNQDLSCRAAQASANSEVFTKHETRITAFYPPRCPVHHCSRLFTIVHHCSLLFSKKILFRQVSPHRQPFSKGLASRSRRLPGALGCGDDKMKPC